MVSIVGPLVSQVTEKPLIVVEDSKRNADIEGVSLKIAGEYGATEFSLENIAEIHQVLGDFLSAKGINPEVESAAARLLRQGAGLLVTND